MKTIFILFLALVFRISAQAQSTEVAGQIFITTKAGSSVKLGGVTVSIYSHDEWEVERSRLNRIAIPAANKCLDLARRYAANGAADEALDQIAKSDIIIDTAWHSFKPSHFATKTDADGKFSLTNGVAEAFVIVAATERDIGDHVEHCHWAVPSSDLEDFRHILLSNENMKVTKE